jgi:ERCC4-type nuclease
MEPISVQADDRETQSPVVSLLRQSPVFRLTITRLRLGDYLVDDRFLFERKSLVDLAAAINDGRLFHQALRLTGTTFRPAIVLEGTSRDFERSGMRWERVQGALVTVSLFLGVPLLRTRTPEETVRTMLFAARQAHTYAAGALPRHGWRPRGKHARQLYILQGLPGIGPDRARRLLARFGSIEAIVNAQTKDLQSVEGIGKQIADKLRWSVEETACNYS